MPPRPFRTSRASRSRTATWSWPTARACTSPRPGRGRRRCSSTAGRSTGGRGAGSCPRSPRSAACSARTCAASGGATRRRGRTRRRRGRPTSSPCSMPSTSTAPTSPATTGAAWPRCSPRSPPRTLRSVAAVSILHPWPRAPVRRCGPGPARLPSSRSRFPSPARAPRPAARPRPRAHPPRQRPGPALHRRRAGRYAEVLRVPARARASSALPHLPPARASAPLARGRYAAGASRPHADRHRRRRPCRRPGPHLAASTATPARPRAPRSSRGAGHFVPEEAPAALLERSEHLAAAA